jgi:hypothetical protein
LEDWVNVLVQKIGSMIFSGAAWPAMATPTGAKQQMSKEKGEAKNGQSVPNSRFGLNKSR